MRLIAQVLVVILVLNLLAPISGVAQQSGKNIAQLREQIAKLEKIDADLETSPEVKDINRNFLSERRTELNALMRKRISALRQYLSTAGGALRPEERQVVEKSIRALAEELGDTDAFEARGPALTATAPPADIPASVAVHAKANSGNEAVYTGSLISFNAYAPKARGYASVSEVVPNPVRQENVGQQEEPKLPGGGEVRVIDTREYEIPKPFKFLNGTAVTLVVKRSPVNTCTLTMKREELKPEPNPLAQFLKVITGLGVIPLFKSNDAGTDVPEEICKDVPAVNPPSSPDVARIEAEIKYLLETLKRSVGELDATRAKYKTLNDKIGDFTGCKNDICDTITVDGKEVVKPEFNTAKNNLKNAVDVELKNEVPSIESAELQMSTLKKAIAEGYKKTNDPAEEAWVRSVNQRLDCLARNLEPIRKKRESLAAARIELERFRDLLNAHQSKVADERRLIADNDAKVTGTITCTNYFTKQVATELVTRSGNAGGEQSVSIEPIPFTVTYQNPPRGSVSAGLLFTTLDKRQIGIQPVRTGTAADGTSTFRLTFAETDRADGQLVPFTFYNHRIWGSRKFSLNGSGGVGVNPNNGATQVEFFFGGSLGFNNFFLQLGGHVGRWQELGGGFTLGDTVTASPPVVPIERRYTVRPSIGVSYKLPLP